MQQRERQTVVEGPVGWLLLDEELAGYAEVGTHELGAEGRQRQLPKRVARQLAALELLAVPVGVQKASVGVTQQVLWCAFTRPCRGRVIASSRNAISSTPFSAV